MAKPPAPNTAAANTAATTTLILSKTETQRVVREVWLVHAFVMLTLLIGLYALWQWTEASLAQEIAQAQTLSTNLKSSQEKLNKVSQEEQEIIRKTRLFQAWQERRVAAPVNELDIQEFLYALAKRHGIGEFEYHNQENAMRQESMSTMLHRPTERAASNKNESENTFAPLQINVLAQQMSFKIQHEKQLFDFLADIANIPELTQKTTPKPPPAIARLSPCKISRISPTLPLSPTQVNFTAQCKIEWLNLMVPPSA